MDVAIRPFTVADAPAVRAAIAASVDHLRPWMPWIADEPHDEAWQRAWILARVKEEAEGGDRFRVIATLADDTIVGGCGLHGRIGPGGYEIGYWIHVDHTRRGYATAAVLQLVDLAFADPTTTHVEIHHDVTNLASGAVASAAGFSSYGTFAVEPKAPAETGTERRWRLTRT
jgi:ribosomal-protein-serine acetyltransferase